MKKIRVGVLMGGASAERQISLVSGMGIASCVMQGAVTPAK